ncbi:unnamed protein product [Lactuca saligna]|uniref:Uncharacterized protein n=1 Tax=Lactuca saligna TaxID=75948 RepID=A0AA35ZP46_LACSI|nr:unnamed protein product [Lactuca saligna]
MNPGTAGTTDVYYKQIMALSMKGYQVISVDIPRVWNNQEWVQAFEKFLDVIDVHHTSLWNITWWILALLFAQHRPRRVKSLILSNAFLDTKYFLAAMPWARVLRPWGDLASRLALISDVASVGPILLSDSLITIMDLEVKMLLILS